MIASFENQAGFGGVMPGRPGAGRAPSEENLLVFYLPDEHDWREATDRMATSGYSPVPAFNPYWDAQGKNYEDPDGYPVVLQNAAWSVVEGLKVRV